MRLDRFLANNTELSRKDVKRALKSGEVLINGEAATNPAEHISPTSLIELSGEPVTELGAGYFMLFKPEGFVCANKDADHPTVFDLLDEPHPGLHVAGRLDIDTTGLVLITGDGAWSHKITSPRHNCTKTYRVSAAEFITDKMIEKLESGVFIGEQKQRTKPAKVERISEDQILLHITEGRYHQVKQMLGAVGNAVEQLHRERIGNIALDENLIPGEYRALIQQEIENA